MITRKKLLAIGAVATSALLVTACAGADEPEQPDDQVVEETEDQVDDTVDDNGEDDAPGDVTAPGTTLALGDTAVLAHPIDGDDGETGLLSATVHEIEPGSSEDLTDLDLGESADGLEPYYLHITVAGVDESSEALAGATLTNAFAGVAAGNPASTLNIIGSFDLCDISSLDSEWTSDSTQDICIVVLSPEGSEVDSVQYSPRDEEYRADPVTWE
ncbi:MAG TPA: hypothetical protein H9830_09725 [Candidatus Agrococcus pullicola]|uniref:Lipoprotein n=1 Tax=Candidatus Agrococcus pullicola TaxID=2838429 RepID=A0A9D2C9R8_9MICO|nr:hypothetical protein [Candidatus Agrococcus pullicola]